MERRDRLHAAALSGLFRCAWSGHVLFRGDARCAPLLAACGSVCRVFAASETSPFLFSFALDLTRRSSIHSFIHPFIQTPGACLLPSALLGRYSTSSLAAAGGAGQTGGKAGSYFEGLGGLFGWASHDLGASAAAGAAAPALTPSGSLGAKGAHDKASAASALAPLLGMGVGLGPEWREAFVMVQGRRVAWWGCEADIDAGRACQVR